MPDPIDLSGEIADALDTAFERGRPVVVGYVDDDGYASLSFRGSAHVEGRDRIAIWARKREEGLAKAVQARPRLSLLYFGPGGPGPRFLSIRGTAHVDESAGDRVYAAMPAAEQERDPERKGVAVIVEVERVRGLGADGPFEQAR